LITIFSPSEGFGCQVEQLWQCDVCPLPSAGLNTGIPSATACHYPGLPMGSLSIFALGCQARTPPNQAVLGARVALRQLAQVSLHHFQGQSALLGQASVPSPD